MPLPSNIIYIPILAVRPAEMAALHELPEKDKDLLLPAIQLQPWLSAIEFEKAIDRVVSAYGPDRPWIANLNQEYTGPKSGLDRAAVDDFNKLKSPKNGYANWCAFIENHRQLIPTVQMGDISQFEAQSTRLAGLGRGLVLHLPIDTNLDDSLLTHLASVCRPAVETAASTAIGFGVALATQRVVFPLFGLDVPVAHDLAIACIFTVVSLVRGYIVRRVFNRCNS